jgi:twinkle protein
VTDVAATLADQGIRLRDHDVGEHKVTCPRCSAQRKKKHEPCLNVRLGEDGGAVWQCWHCGWTGGTGSNGAANGYEPAARPITRPQPPRAMDTGDRLFEWFTGRSISHEIVEAMGIYATGEGKGRKKSGRSP